ncbi:NDR1/HIN1-like protein 1 [Iris pallida]|uniref:NDR1/HIN1-like protein 1 n=1 Tax=Iris pallida TaxID=29817 RepID=A0AAX6FXD1_IRIPA|nr:NDR1/HIN1-like protein 1 [Iris pallida]KAJ6840620.1 NDR1/HIN1-like protein 1 [Iris pallida]
MSKDCGNHGRDKFFRSVLSCIALLVIIVLIVILIVYLVLRPHKPRFYLQDATVISFNLSSPNILSTYLQAIHQFFFFHLIISILCSDSMLNIFSQSINFF